LQNLNFKNSTFSPHPQGTILFSRCQFLQFIALQLFAAADIFKFLVHSLKHTNHQNTGEIHKKDISVVTVLLNNRKLRRILAPKREEET